jgi:hypothetical protein
MATSLSEEEFLTWVRSFRHSAFRLETRREYTMTYERADYERFCAGSPVPPSELDWWRPWLDRVAQYTAEGKTVGRVRLVDTPPTDYQRWLIWSTSWHTAVGEDIRYLPRATALEIDLPMQDWWLLDDAYVIIMDFTGDGGIAGKSLIIDPATVANYHRWRDLARHHSASARQIMP